MEMKHSDNENVIASEAKQSHDYALTPKDMRLLLRQRRIAMTTGCVLISIFLISDICLFAVSSYEVSKGSESCCTTAGGVVSSRNDIEKKFIAANSLYEKADYRGAASAYECLAGECGAENFSVYYNLGNSYYRLNEIGKAALNYERAAKINPRDEDIKSNLTFIKSIIKDNEPGGFWRSAYGFFTAGELAAAFFAINILFFTLLGFYVKFKNTSYNAFLKRASYWAAAVMLVAGLWAWLRISDSMREYGIVISPQCEVRSGPRPDYAAGLSVPEGKKVIILGEDGSWYAIGLPLEKYKGWVEKSNVERILKSY